MEGGAYRAELRSGDAHGIEGVDVRDVETATPIHQHLGEALLADDGVNDERVATWSGDVERMVSLIKSDRGVRPAKERGDGRLSGTCLSIAYLVLALRVDSIGSPKNHEAFLRVGEAVFILACHASFLGLLHLAFPFFGLAACRRKRLRSSQSL